MTPRRAPPFARSLRRSRPGLVVTLVALGVAACATRGRSAPIGYTPSDELAAASPEAPRAARDAPSAEASAVVEPAPSASVAASASPSAAPSADAPPKFACAPPDHGFGNYHPYVALPRGRLLVPIVDAPPPGSAYDVLLHFHFHDAIRRVFVEVAHPMALAGLDLGEGSKAYGDAFADPEAFLTMRASIEAGLRERTGDERAHIGRLFLSSWSAGFGATTRILKQHPAAVDGLVFLDSLYAPADKDEDGEPKPRSVFAPAVAPTLAYARRALAGDGFLFLSYSRTATHGYASTEDVARHLEQRLGLREAHAPPSEEPRALLGSIDRGAVHVRAFGGNDAKAHCHHLAVVRDALELLRAR